MYHYQSETTQFLNQYIEQHPEETKQRLHNRGLLWDVELDEQEQAGFNASHVPKKPYAYQAD